MTLIVDGEAGRSRPGEPARVGAATIHIGRVVGMLALLFCVSGGSLRAEGEEEHHGTATPPSSALGLAELHPKLSLHGFTDFVARVNRSDGNPSASETSFALGELDLFFVSRLADNLSFSSEIVFESDEHGDFVVDVERMSLRYKVSDSFWIAVGRHHTALGYWNEAYHHGLILQPTVERPEALKFEDNGGILPVHTVGAALGGRQFHGPWALDYEANIGNGRGLTSEDVQNASDSNDNKSLTLKLTFSRERESRVLFGPMYHVDRIPAGPGTPDPVHDMDERILGAHFAYRNERVEILAEYYHVHHEVQATGVEFNHPTYYAIAIWRPSKLKPYGGFDRLDLDRADPFYASVESAVSRAIVGLRWDVHPFTALKFEYRHNDRPGDNDGDEFLFQAAFTF